jgi:hypothetical protein
MGNDYEEDEQEVVTLTEEERIHFLDGLEAFRVWQAAWEDVPPELWPAMTVECGFRPTWAEMVEHQRARARAFEAARMGVFDETHAAAMHAYAAFHRRMGGGLNVEWSVVETARLLREAGVPIDLHA